MPVSIVNAVHDRREGPHIVPEPLATSSSGLRHGRRHCWKPPEWKEMGRHLIYVIKLRNNGMSRCYSPRPGTALTLFDPLLDLCPPLLGLKPDRKLHWKLFNVEMRRQCSTNRHIASTQRKESSWVHLTPSPPTCYVIRAGPARCPQLPGFKHIRWQYGKQSGMIRLGQCSVRDVRPRNGGMSRRYSPRSRMALTLFVPFPYSRYPYKPWDMAMIR
jgi:hypothetical protein